MTKNAIFTIFPYKKNGQWNTAQVNPKYFDAYKAPVRRVFDMLNLPELENPLPHQKQMLSEICDGVEIINVDHFNYKRILQDHTKEGDYLYSTSYNGELKLVGIYPPKK